MTETTKPVFQLVHMDITLIVYIILFLDEIILF